MQPYRFQIEFQHFFFHVQFLDFFGHLDDLPFQLFAQRVVFRFQLAQFQPVLLTFFHFRLDDVLLLDDLHRQFVHARLLLIEFLLEDENRLPKLFDVPKIVRLLGVDGRQAAVLLLQFVELRLQGSVEIRLLLTLLVGDFRCQLNFGHGRLQLLAMVLFTLQIVFRCIEFVEQRTSIVGVIGQVTETITNFIENFVFSLQEGEKLVGVLDNLGCLLIGLEHLGLGLLVLAKRKRDLPRRSD